MQQAAAFAQDIKVHYGSGSGKLVRARSIVTVNDDHVIDSDHHPAPMPKFVATRSLERLPSVKVMNVGEEEKEKVKLEVVKAAPVSTMLKGT